MIYQTVPFSMTLNDR